MGSDLENIQIQEIGKSITCMFTNVQHTLAPYSHILVFVLITSLYIPCHYNTKVLAPQRLN